MEPTELQLAWEAGDVPAMRAAVREGVDSNAAMVSSDRGPLSLLEAALRRDDPALVDAILTLPGLTAERSLARHGFWAWAPDVSPAVIRTFVERSGIDRGRPDADGRTLLIELAAGTSTPDEDLVTWLVERGGVDQRARDGTTALFHALVRGHRGVARRLLDAGADPNAASDLTGWTALSTLVAMGDVATAGWLLTVGGVDPNAPDREGATAVHHAVRAGSSGSLLALLAVQQSDPNAADMLGRTPLMDAARHLNVPAVGMLLDHPRIDVNRVDADRRTALAHAVIAGATLAVIAILARDDVNLAVTDRHGSTALELARAAGQVRIADLLSAGLERVGEQPDRPSNEPPEAAAPPPPPGPPDFFPSIAEPLQRPSPQP